MEPQETVPKADIGQGLCKAPRHDSDRSPPKRTPEGDDDRATAIATGDENERGQRHAKIETRTETKATPRRNGDSRGRQGRGVPPGCSDESHT
jgi:hypothetical protein